MEHSSTSSNDDDNDQQCLTKIGCIPVDGEISANVGEILNSSSKSNAGSTSNSSYHHNKETHSKEVSNNDQIRPRESDEDVSIHNNTHGFGINTELPNETSGVTNDSTEFSSLEPSLDPLLQRQGEYDRSQNDFFSKDNPTPGMNHNTRTRIKSHMQNRIVHNNNNNGDDNDDDDDENFTVSSIGSSLILGASQTLPSCTSVEEEEAYSNNNINKNAVTKLNISAMDEVIALIANRLATTSSDASIKTKTLFKPQHHSLPHSMVRKTSASSVQEFNNIQTEIVDPTLSEELDAILEDDVDNEDLHHETHEIHDSHDTTNVGSSIAAGYVGREALDQQSPENSTKFQPDAVSDKSASCDVEAPTSRIESESNLIAETHVNTIENDGNVKEKLISPSMQWIHQQQQRQMELVLRLQQLESDLHIPSTTHNELPTEQMIYKEVGAACTTNTIITINDSEQGHSQQQQQQKQDCSKSSEVSGQSSLPSVRLAGTTPVMGNASASTLQLSQDYEHQQHDATVHRSTPTAMLNSPTILNSTYKNNSQQVCDYNASRLTNPNEQHQLRPQHAFTPQVNAQLSTILITQPHSAVPMPESSSLFILQQPQETTVITSFPQLSSSSGYENDKQKAELFSLNNGSTILLPSSTLSFDNLQTAEDESWIKLISEPSAHIGQKQDSNQSDTILSSLVTTTTTQTSASRTPTVLRGNISEFTRRGELFGRTSTPKMSSGIDDTNYLHQKERNCISNNLILQNDINTNVSSSITSSNLMPLAQTETPRNTTVTEDATIFHTPKKDLVISINAPTSSTRINNIKNSHMGLTMGRVSSYSYSPLASRKLRPVPPPDTSSNGYISVSSFLPTATGGIGSTAPTSTSMTASWSPAKGGRLWRLAGEVVAQQQLRMHEEKLKANKNANLWTQTLIVERMRSRADVDAQVPPPTPPRPSRSSDQQEMLARLAEQDEEFLLETGFFANKRIRVVQLLIIGLVGLLLGWLGNFFVSSSCHFASLDVIVGQNSTNIFTLHFGLWNYSPVDSALNGYKYCYPYGGSHVADAPILSRIANLAALLFGTYSLVVLWLYLITGRVAVAMWRGAIYAAVTAGFFQLLTLCFFIGKMCLGKACDPGPGAITSIVTAVAWVVLGAELHYNSPIVPVDEVDLAEALSSSGSVVAYSLREETPSPLMMTSLEMADITGASQEFFERFNQKRKGYNPPVLA